jgi:hypothetical protein
MIEVKTTPANMVANRIYIKRGLQYSFDDRPFMIPIFDDGYRRIVLKTARQISKSTTLAAKGLIACEALGPYSVLALTPSKDQTSKFSHDRLTPTIQDSPAICELLDRTGVNNVLEKSFVNGSRYYLKYGKENADSSRGISCDETHYDEVQDMNLGPVEAVTKECMFTSPHKRSLYSGTPKSRSNGIEQRLWKKSDQREWMVRCHHHSPIYFQKLGMENVGKEGPICNRCGNALNTLDGLWVKTLTRTEDGKSPHLHGYHIPQILFPTNKVILANGKRGILDWEEFLLDIENNDEGTVMNEKFGESADSADRPISEDELKATCDPTRDMPYNYEKRMIGEYTFAGIDWGWGIKSATALVIGQFDPQNGKVFRIVHCKKYFGKEADPSHCIPDIVDTMNRFRVLRCHTDFGSGLGMNSQIRDAKGDDFLTTNYWSSSIKGKKMIYDKDLDRFVVNKSVTLARLFLAMKKKAIRVAFRWEHFKEFGQDVLNEFREERKNGDPYYDHKDDEPDDFLHAITYCWQIASWLKYNSNFMDNARTQSELHSPFRT